MDIPALNFSAVRYENPKIFLGIKIWTSQKLLPTQQSKSSRLAVYSSQKVISIIKA